MLNFDREVMVVLSVTRVQNRFEKFLLRVYEMLKENES